MKAVVDKLETALESLRGKLECKLRHFITTLVHVLEDFLGDTIDRMP